MDRRDFLLNACRTCAALALLPAAASLEGCAPSAKAMAVKDGIIDVPLDALGASGSTVISASGLSEKLFISKRADGSYSAVELKCPHKGGPVKEKEGQLVCSWHGSTFGRDGALVKGPSKAGLKSYPVEASGAMLRVRVA